MSGRVSGTAIDNQSARGVVLEWPARQLDPDVRVYCAYNATRQKFLCSFIDTADLMPENLRDRLDTLTRESQKALWLVPFRGIAPDQVNAPIDLVFLDQNYCVLAMAQSFPNSQPGPCNWPVGSAIALPAGFIASSGTLTGDQLILCSPEKMKRRLFELRMSIADEPAFETFSHNSYSVSKPISSPGGARIHLANWDDLLKQVTPEHASASPLNPPVAMSERAEAPEKEPISRSKNWLFCLLAPHRKERRKTSRESLPWIAAYFFTGATPAPATIRNISSLGMYVNTSERWYPGTIIQVTLSDWRLPSPDRSMTVNAMAVRSDDAGVGLRFVFPKGSRGKAVHVDEGEVSREQLREFLQHFKGIDRPTTWRQKLRQ